MANKAVAPSGAGSGLLTSGAVGFSNVMNVDDDIPVERGEHAIAYKNSRGQLIDAWGRKVNGLGYAQEAGLIGTEAQIASKSYAPTQEDIEGEEGNEPDGAFGDSDETDKEDE